MDPTGIINLDFISYAEDINIVLVADDHGAFDPYASNAIHNWIDTTVTKSDTSYIVSESERFIDPSYSFGVLPMYFKKENITFCDVIRFTFRFIPVVSGSNAEKVTKFTNKINETSNVLAAIDLTDYKCTENITTIDRHSFSYLTLRFLIGVVHHFGTIYNRVVGTHAQQNVDLLRSKLTEMQANQHPSDRTKELSKVSQSVLKEYCSYELLLFHFVHVNFVYRVVNFIKPYTDEYTNEQLWNIVSNWLLDSLSSSLRMQKVIMSLARMLDYMIILKCIDIYSKSKQQNQVPLIWITAGNGHTEPIILFLRELFAFILVGKYSRNVKLDPHIMRHPAITTIVGMHPAMGLRKPPDISPDAPAEVLNITENLENTKKTSISAFVETIKNKVPECYITSITNTLNHEYVTLDALPRIFNAIRTKEILKAFDESDMEKALLMTSANMIASGLAVLSASGCNPHFDSNGKYVYDNLNRLAFSKAFMAIYLPVFSTDDEDTILTQNVTFASYFQDPNSVQFEKLKENVDILTIPPNGTPRTEPVSLVQQELEVEYDSDIDESDPNVSSEYGVNYEYYLGKRKIKRAFNETNKDTIAIDTYNTTVQHLKTAIKNNNPAPGIDNLYRTLYKLAVEKAATPVSGGNSGMPVPCGSTIQLLLLAILIVALIYILYIIYKLLRRSYSPVSCMPSNASTVPCKFSYI